MADGKSGLSPNAWSPEVLAREIELQVSLTHIQWRYTGQTTWTDLIALSELTGAPGPQGTPGADGADGADGREIELQTDPTYIQWRYVGDPTWFNLIALASLVGPQGPQGDPGPAGPAGAPGVVQSIVAGTGISVDNTDPANPIVSATGGGGTAPVGLGSQLPADGLYPTMVLDSPSWTLNTPAASQSTYWPFYVDSDIEIKALEANVGTASGTAIIHVEIHEFLGGGKLGPMVAGGQLDVTATGIRTLTLGAPVVLTQGWYFMLVHKGAAGTPSLWSVAAPTAEGTPWYFSLTVSDPWSIITTTTEVQVRAVVDANHPGGDFTAGEDWTGTTLTAANTTTVTFAPMIFLKKN